MSRRPSSAGLHRVRIGTGVSGAGAALWVRATPLDDTPATDHTRELASSYKAVVVTILQQRGAWQFIDKVQRMSDPSLLSDTAGYAPYLDLDQKLWLLANPDVDERLDKLIEWGRTHLAELDVSDRIRDDVREGMEKNQREFLLRQQLAAIRKELGEDEPDGADDYRGRVEAGRPARQGARSGAARGGQARTRQRPEPRGAAGSAPGSTPCWSCPGRRARPTTPTSWRRGPSSTPTTRVSTT